MRARQKLGEILSAFEFLDQASLELTLAHLEVVRNPLPDTQTPFYLVVETHGSNEGHDYEKLQVAAGRLPCLMRPCMRDAPPLGSVCCSVTSWMCAAHASQCTPVVACRGCMLLSVRIAGAACSCCLCGNAQCIPDLPSSPPSVVQPMAGRGKRGAQHIHAHDKAHPGSYSEGPSLSHPYPVLTLPYANPDPCPQAFLEEVMEEGWVLDGTIAQDSAQAAGIWGLREGISVALKHAGAPVPPPLPPVAARRTPRLAVCRPARCAQVLLHALTGVPAWQPCSTLLARTRGAA